MPWVYVHSAIYETYLVQWFSIDLCSIGEGVGQCARVYVHSAIYDLFSVVVLHRSMVYVPSEIYETYLL